MVAKLTKSLPLEIFFKKEREGKVENEGRRKVEEESITLFLNLYCEIHEFCSLYIK